MYGVILFGKPGSGKSSIGKGMAKVYGYKYISSGDIARDLAKSDSKIGEILNAGGMAPEPIMRSMVRHAISECISNDQCFILDGFPRYDYQDEYLCDMFPNLAMIRVLIDVDDSTAIKRCRGRGREDEGATMTRLDYYHKNTEKLTDTCSIVIDNNADTYTTLIMKLEAEVHECL